MSDKLTRRAKRYRGEKLTVSYDLTRCMHAAECVKSGLTTVFNRDNRPWVTPDGAQPDQVIDVIERCPSGALQYQRHDAPQTVSSDTNHAAAEDSTIAANSGTANSGTNEVGHNRGAAETPKETPESNSIRPQPNSALYVRGDITLQHADGSQEHATRLTLCRCGHSKNQPFCDHSHQQVTFQDAGVLGESNLSETVLDTNQVLELHPAPNGPLLVRGAFALRSASHDHIVYGAKAALCRCGRSDNKPFCDGSHTQHKEDV
jgi:CDGSH-type Zn-finger protein/uncharacterized Fe-S cluster protein YjdI